MNSRSVLEPLRCGRHLVAFDRGPVIMGILNMSRESFAGDGLAPGAVGQAVARAEEMVLEGAGILDVGGQTAQRSVPMISVGEEIDRVVPLIERLTRDMDVPVSIDSFRPEVARAAVEAGAGFINDIGGLQNGEMAVLAAEHGVPLVIMHIRGRPKEIEYDERYDDVVGEVETYLRENREGGDARCAADTDRYRHRGRVQEADSRSARAA